MDIRVTKGPPPRLRVVSQARKAFRGAFGASRVLSLFRLGAWQFALLAGLVALAGALAVRGVGTNHRLDASQRMYSHTLEVISVSRDAMSTLQDLVIGERGFVVTRNAAFLKPYEIAEADIDAKLGQLAQLTADNPRQINNVAALRQAASALRGRITQVIALGRAGKWTDANREVGDAAGLHVMGDVRAAMAAVQNEERRLLWERAANGRANARANARALSLYLTALAGLGVFVIVFGAYSAFSGMSARVRAELARDRAAAALRLAQEERRFRTITEAMPQIVWQTDNKGVLTFVNARWTEYTGASPDKAAWRGHVHPDDLDKAREAWGAALKGGQPYEADLRLRSADGGYRWFLCRAFPLRDEFGGIECWLGTGTDIHEARLNLEARELLSQELSHRIKNIFSVVGSLIALSARSDPSQKAFASTLRDRIAALARAHEFVRPHSAASAARNGRRTFSAFMQDLLAAYGDGVHERVVLSGDDFLFGDRSATPLALLFHELATNAAKYGAFSVPQGRVEVETRRHRDSWTISWREIGGPAIASEPAREGFGTTLARLSVEGQLGGSISKEWRKEGLRVAIHLPAATLERV